MNIIYFIIIINNYINMYKNLSTLVVNAFLITEKTLVQILAGGVVCFKILFGY